MSDIFLFDEELEEEQKKYEYCINLNKFNDIEKRIKETMNYLSKSPKSPKSPNKSPKSNKNFIKSISI